MNKYIDPSLSLPLSDGFLPAWGREDFIVSKCNQQALSWIEKWPQWPSNTMCLLGTKGCGKSHLAQIWSRESESLVFQGWSENSPSPQTILKDQKHILIEDIDDYEIDQVSFFHLFNAIKEKKGSVLITSRQLPEHWPLTLPDLISRLSTFIRVPIGQPDDHLLMLVMVKIFKDRRLEVSPKLLDYILPRIERSFHSIQIFAQQLDMLVYVKRKPEATLSMVRQILHHMKDSSNP